MSQNAIVKKVVHPGVVEVSLMRQMECGLSCSSCEGCPQRPKEEILALASDPQGGAKPGDWVEVEPASGSAIERMRSSVCRSAERNSRLPALRSSTHLM